MALGLFFCVCEVLCHLACLAVEQGVQVLKSPVLITLVDLTVYSFSSISFILCIFRLCCWVFIKLVLYLAEFILYYCVISVFDLRSPSPDSNIATPVLSVFTWCIFVFIYFQRHCSIELEFLPNSM